jgi:DNA-binding CsgD family transcriptional regulator
MRHSQFDSPAWHATIGDLLAADDDQAIAGALTAAIGQAVVHDGTCLLAFHADAPPEVLHHTLGPRRARHYLDRYLAGPYLLDPLYALAINNDKPSMCRFRDAKPDRFHSSEYYKQYCDQTHLKDEMDFLVDVGGGSALAMVVGRREKMFSKTELARLELIEPIICAAMRRTWERWRQGNKRSEPDKGIHQRLIECYRNFGDDVLTQREREITQLLLRGHSTKSVARELDIAPGTVMVHKRNLFSKLGITSQYELFSRFIENLSQS